MAKIMLNGVNYSDTSGVSGVKGNTETTYRTGNVNLTPENIGAVNKTRAQINKILDLATESRDEAFLLGTSSPSGYQPPLKIIVDKLIYEGDTGSGMFQTKGKINMVGDYAEIRFDYSNMGRTTISRDIITSQLADCYQVEVDRLKITGLVISNVVPNGTNNYTLGNTTFRWKQLFANTSVISTSDRNLKKDIQNLDEKWIKFFMLLQPKSYLFKDGESGRTHVGFISQDVEEALEACGLTPLDFAGFCKDQKVERKKEIEQITHPANEETGNPEWTEDKETEKEQPMFDDNGNPVYIYSLRYEEFIALNTMMIQKLYKQNQIFEDRLNKIEQLIYKDN